MPTRKTGTDDQQDSGRTQFQQRHQKGATTNKGNSPAAYANKRKKVNAEDDAWEDIMNADTSNDYNDGPSKFDFNYWLKPGETDIISFVDENPVVFQGHTLKCLSKAGKTYYRTEACAAAHGEECAFCDTAETNKNVSKAKRIIMFRIKSGRGEWNSEDGDYDGIPTLKFFQTATVLAQSIGTFKNDQNMDGLTENAFVLTKNENYVIQPKMVKKGGALYFDDPVELPEEEQDNMMTIEELYAPMAYDNAVSLMDAVLSTQQDNNQRRGGGRSAGRGNSGGSNGFYGNNNRGGGSGYKNRNSRR